MPTSTTDARFDFSALPQAQSDAMFAYINNSGLAKYAGSYAPKNVFNQPWVNRLDLHVEHDASDARRHAEAFGGDVVRWVDPSLSAGD